MSISSGERLERIHKLQDQLRTDQVDAIIVSEEEDIYYLTGLSYKGLERLFLLVIKQDRVCFILPQMELAHLQAVDHVEEIVLYWEYPAAAPDRWQDVLLQELSDCGTIALGEKSPYEIAHHLNTHELKTINAEYLSKLRWVKSESEIEQIRAAAKYCDDSISILNNRAYYGMTELEVFAIGQDIQKRLIKETEFDYAASDVLIAAWPSRIAHEPHGIPKVSDLLIEGTHISLSFLRVNGYAAELERTFFTAAPTEEQRKMFQIMLEARAAAYEVLKAGAVAQSVDEAARAIFIQAGLKDHIMHRTGHGIGMGNHEGPYLSLGDTTVLQENMIVSIEPGIYIEGVGGFRHSDTVRVTADGYEIMTSCPDQLEDLIFTSAKPLQKIKGKIIKRMFNL